MRFSAPPVIGADVETAVGGGVAGSSARAAVVKIVSSPITVMIFVMSVSPRVSRDSGPW